MLVTNTKRRANRENSLKSTGPNTDEGKRASSMNALIHGGRAESHILPGDEPEEVRQFFIDYMMELNPVNSVQAQLAHRMAGIAWKIERLHRAERKLMLDEQLEQLKDEQQKHSEWHYDKGKPIATNEIAPWETDGPDMILINHIYVRSSALRAIWDQHNKLERTLLSMFRLYRQLRKDDRNFATDEAPMNTDHAGEKDAADERRCTRMDDPACDMDELETKHNHDLSSFVFHQPSDLRSSASICGSNPLSPGDKTIPNEAKVNLEKMEVRNGAQAT
jgi:hypothetical protein